jgi:sarcosine oxidase
MNQTADIIVLGCGGFGSSAVYNLVTQGLSVIGIDQHQPPHAYGSSHGETRVIRKAYFEHPAYVPLLQRAYELWAELSELSSSELYVETGLLLAGPEQGEVITGARASAAMHSLPLDSLTPDDVRRRFNHLRIPEELSCVFEQQAGYLKVEKCIEAFLSEAASAAERNNTSLQLLTGHKVISVKTTKQQVTVNLSDGSVLSAGALVVCAGAWTSQLFEEYADWITLRRKVQFWHAVDPASRANWQTSPAYLFELPDGCFYGFPTTDGHTVKVCEHSGGQQISLPEDARLPVADHESDPVQRFVSQHLNGVETKPQRSRGCIYSMSPDSHFLLDRLPDQPVIVAAGFSGHGFKFTSVLGETISQWITTGTTQLPVDFLSRQRLFRQ